MKNWWGADMSRKFRSQKIPHHRKSGTSYYLSFLFVFGAWLVFELHSLLVTKKCIGIEKVTFDGIKTMTSRTPITLFTLKFLNIKRTRNYYFKTIGYCSRTKVKSSLMLRRFIQPGQTTNWLAKVNRLPLRENKWFLASFPKQGTCSQGDRRV